MKSLSLIMFLALGALPGLASSEYLTSNSWAGSNNYYLHALSGKDQTAYINSLQASGAKVVRLWATGIDAGCKKSSTSLSIPNYETVIGEYNTATLDALDVVLAKLHDVNIKAIISPHDANLLPENGSTTGFNGVDIYGTTYSSDEFYTNATAAAQFDARLTSMLNYVSPFFGKRWADLSEVIMAFDLQNEPMIASPSLLTSDDPANWLCSRATLMQSVISDSNSTSNSSSDARVRVATGGIGGSQYSGHEYNTLTAALNCSAIDIMSIHAYMSTAKQWTPYIPTLCLDSENVGKHCMVEEWGVGTESTDDSVAVQASLFNDYGVPWLYWMVIPGKSIDETCEMADGTCCHEGLSSDPTEDFEISFTSSRANFTTLFQNASSITGLQDWTGYI